MHRVISAVAALVLLGLSASTVLATKTDTYICHATNDPGHFNFLGVDDNALAGHRVGNEFHVNRKTGEQDYFASDEEIAQGSCGEAESTPTPSESESATPTPAVTPTPEPSFVQCDDEIQVPELTECPTPTQSIGVPATATPTPRNEIPNTAAEGPNAIGWLLIVGAGLLLAAMFIFVISLGMAASRADDVIERKRRS